jgi:hypothetical protein
MDCFVALLETLASADSVDLSSGTFWFIKDTVKRYSDELESLSHELMEKHRELTDQTTSLKPKKNANKTKNK